MENKTEETKEIIWHDYDVEEIMEMLNVPVGGDIVSAMKRKEIVCDLMIMFDSDKKTVKQVLLNQPWMQKILKENPSYVDAIIDSAALHVKEEGKTSHNSMPSLDMQQAVYDATECTYLQVINDIGFQYKRPTENNLLDYKLDRYGKKIEALFDDYPILKDICKGLEHNQYPAALYVAGGLMATLMTRCTYRFYHRPDELRRLNNQTVVVGDPGSGKSFATRLYNCLALPIKEADALGTKAINDYNELMRTISPLKDKPKKPKVIIRDHPARTSNSRFIEDMAGNVEIVDGKEMTLHSLTFDTELDNTIRVQRGGTWMDKKSMMLKAFHNEQDGQYFKNDDSRLTLFNVHWNFIYTGTPIALDNLVNPENFGTGEATRLSCVPMPPTNFKMLKREEEVDTSSDERLIEWARKLDRMKGELSIGKIVDELYDWCADKMEDAKYDESRTEEMLLKRCPYHGICISAPFMVIRHWDDMHQDGNYWCGTFDPDEKDIELALLITDMQYDFQLHYFGWMADLYFAGQTYFNGKKPRRRNLIAFYNLPEVFTVKDVMRCYNKDNEGSARMTITRLEKDGMIVKCEERSYNGTHIRTYKKVKTTF